MTEITERHREWAKKIDDAVTEKHDILKGSTPKQRCVIIAAKLAALEGDPPEGLKDALRGAIVGSAYVTDHPYAIDELTTDTLAAVKPLFDAYKRKRDEEERELIFEMHSDIQKLQADNEALTKQIEYQREIHNANQAAFDKIHNEAHEKIAALEKQVEELSERLKPSPIECHCGRVMTDDECHRLGSCQSCEDKTLIRIAARKEELRKLREERKEALDDK